MNLVIDKKQDKRNLPTEHLSSVSLPVSGDVTAEGSYKFSHSSSVELLKLISLNVSD